MREGERREVERGRRREGERGGGGGGDEIVGRGFEGIANYML